MRISLEPVKLTDRRIEEVVSGQLAQVPVYISNTGRKRANVTISVYDNVTRRAYLYEYGILDPGRSDSVLVDYVPPSDYSGRLITLTASAALQPAAVSGVCFDDGDMADNRAEASILYVWRGVGVGSHVKKRAVVQGASEGSRAYEQLTVKLEAAAQLSNDSLSITFSLDHCVHGVDVAFSDDGGRTYAEISNETVQRFNMPCSSAPLSLHAIYPVAAGYSPEKVFYFNVSVPQPGSTPVLFPFEFTGAEAMGIRSPKPTATPSGTPAASAPLDCDISIRLNEANSLTPAVSSITAGRLVPIPIRIENSGQQKANVTVEVWSNASQESCVQTLMAAYQFGSIYYYGFLEPGKADVVPFSYCTRGNYSEREIAIYANVTIKDAGSRVVACSGDRNLENNRDNIVLPYVYKGIGVGSQLTKTAIYYAALDMSALDTIKKVGDVTVKLESVRRIGENAMMVTATTGRCVEAAELAISDDAGTVFSATYNERRGACPSPQEFRIVYAAEPALSQNATYRFVATLIGQNNTVVEYPFEFMGFEIR